MLGHPGSRSLLSALSANPHTGIAMQRKIWIYGLFSPDGVCHYVGETRNRFQRSEMHRVQKPGLTFRVLRGCEQGKAHLIESQVIKAYKRRGQCRFNKKSDPQRIPRCTARPIFCCEVNKVFESVAHAAEELQISDSTIYSCLKDPLRNEMRFYYLDYYNLNLQSILDWSI